MVGWSECPGAGGASLRRRHARCPEGVRGGLSSRVTVVSRTRLRWGRLVTSASAAAAETGPSAEITAASWVRKCRFAAPPSFRAKADACAGDSSSAGYAGCVGGRKTRVRKTHTHRAFLPSFPRGFQTAVDLQPRLTLGLASAHRSPVFCPAWPCPEGVASLLSGPVLSPLTEGAGAVTWSPAKPLSCPPPLPSLWDTVLL